jgi:nucleotide-binding universal stress UspA family protein
MMTFTAILTHVQAEPESSPRLACAIALAERFEATLIGLGAEMIPPPAYSGGGLYSLHGDWAHIMTEANTHLDLAGKRFAEATQRLGARASWRSEIRLPGQAMAAAARAADLIVAGGTSRTREDAYFDASVAELAITSGRPVLVAPATGAPPEAKRIVLAWKDTREARRATADALPFLKAAEAVQVVAICGKAEVAEVRSGADEVAGHLRRHGAKAEARVIEAHANGETILEAARGHGADLIVAGAYGHTRLGEWVFGGVTDDLLGQRLLSLLLSH